MGYYKAIANGNADTLAIWQTWNGSSWVAASSLPSTSDDVYTNNFIVTVTTSQSYLSWNRSSVAAPYNITQGGQFQIDGSNNILISGEIYGTNVNQTANSPLSACVNRLATHIGKMSIIGNQNGGSVNYCYGFFNNSTYEVTSIVGNQNSGTGSSSIGFWNNAAATFTSIVGNQIGGSSSIGFWNNAAATFTSIIGNQNGGTGSSAIGFYNNAAATFTSIVGNQNGGGGGSAYGFFNNGGTFTNPIIGNQVANAAYAFYNNTASTNIEFQGNAYASGVAAIYNAQITSTIIYEGNVYNNLAVMAIRSDRIFLKVTPTTVWEFSDFDGDTQYLYGAGVNTGHPTESDVRDGVVYGPSDEFEGTLIQPPFTIPDFIAALKADDLGIRLGKCATTEEVDSTIASFNV